MEVGGPTSVATSPLVRAQAKLHHFDERAYPAYEALKAGKVVLGGAPITLGVSLTTHGLKAALDPRQSTAIHHAGWAADGLIHGLLYKGGLLHDAAASKAPWLVKSRAAPASLGRVAGTVARVTHYGRLGLLGVGGTMGALRAANAVAHGGGNALLETRDGRGGALQAIGSALLMVRHPAAYLAGAAAFGMAFANDLV